MRVIVVGAEGAVGRAVLGGIADHRQVTQVIELSEIGARSPLSTAGLNRKIERRPVDLLGELSDEFRFADAVVYLGWPHSGTTAGASQRHQLSVLAHVCESVGAVGVRVFLYASSASAYSPAQSGAVIDESWPTSGTNSFFRSLRMAQAESLISRFEIDHPLIRTVRLRPSLIVNPSVNAGGWRARTAKRLLRLADGRPHLRFVPDVEPFVLHCLHVSDFVSALCLALTNSVAGSFNVAAEPITSALLAEYFGADLVRIAPRYVVRILTLASRLGVVPLSADRVELMLRTPAVDTTRARHELGWVPQHCALSIVEEWFARLDSPSMAPPPVEPDSQEVDLRALHQASLDCFGRAVHAIRGDEWQLVSDEQGLRLWQLVAVVAREQYRLALMVRGYDDERIEAELPGDPLGISRSDGWDLAAERGVLAVGRWDEREVRADDPFESGFEQCLAQVVCDTARLGELLGRTIGFENLPAPELSEFVQERVDQR